MERKIIKHDISWESTKSMYSGTMTGLRSIILLRRIDRGAQYNIRITFN